MRWWAVLLCALPAVASDGFVLVRSGLVRTSDPGTRIDDFEIADHPVTNAEYKLFIEATGHPAPPHWAKGVIPAGMASHPAVFVNRFDVAAYTAWRTAKEKRIYRLPSVSEFDFASRGGVTGANFPWGAEPPEGRANYNPDGTRTIGEWRKYLKPVKSYAANSYGLYDMAGNVWQMVDSYPDLATRGYTFRVITPADREAGFAGGSWARSAQYLRCGSHSSSSSGIRSPELGFRLVREPVGMPRFRTVPRRLIAVTAGDGAVFLSWQLLPGDGPQTGFHVYRATRRDTLGERLTTSPILDATNFTDRTAHNVGNLFYHVRPVGPDATEGPTSERAGVRGSGERTGLIAMFEPTVRQGGFVPGAFVPIFGDLDGDGLFDAVLRLDNGIRENALDPGVPVELEAFSNDGRFLWRRPLLRFKDCFGNANNAPVLIYDLDGDGKGEVVCRLEEGGVIYLAILDGITGEIRRKRAWSKMLTDYARTSSRIHLSIACLDGKIPSVIAQTGLYENEVIEAFDARLNRLWQYRSTMETNGSGSHHADVADVDGDGRDEVFNGSMLLNPDGTLRWAIYRQHPDIVAVKHILPDTKDRQVFYAVERPLDAGAYLVDAKTGKLIWKVNRDDDPRWVHAHIGWVAKIWDGAPGLQMLTNRDGHLAKDQVLFAADGRILLNPFPPGWRPVNWTGGPARDLMTADGRKIGRFTGKAVEPQSVRPPAEFPGLACSVTADIAGDFRDEVVCTGKNSDGHAAVFIFTNTDTVSRREVTRTSSREYRLWLARNMGGGYQSYFEWEKE